MRKYTRFINTDYLFANTAVDSNIDASLLEPFIDSAQELNIQQALGNALYTKLMAMAYDDNVVDPYLTLLTDYVLRTQAEWTMYHALPFINYRLTNKNIAEKKSDNSDAAALNVVTYLRENVRNIAEFYTQRLRDYVINNQALFPEYFGTVGQNLRPKNNSYFSGMFIKGGISGYDDCEQYPGRIKEL